MRQDTKPFTRFSGVAIWVEDWMPGVSSAGIPAILNSDDQFARSGETAIIVSWPQASVLVSR
jgi:hypothetical protein